MRTTLLNPTVWVLAMTAAVAATGAWQGSTAREALGTAVRHATTWPVLIALCTMAAAGIGSRAVLGFLTPGAYAEEVAAARTFLEERGLYSDGGRAEVQALVDGSSAALPWVGSPGISGCQANAIVNRAQFFSNHAHTPMLLLAGVPFVRFAGRSGLGLYAILLLLSCAAVMAMAAVAVAHARLPWNSRPALLVLALIAGWQPVLAGVRQGDAVLAAAGLVAIAWYSARHVVQPFRAAIVAALASCLALPAIGVLPALLRRAPRAAALALLIFISAIGVTAMVAGSEIFAGFMRTVVQTATLYAFAPQNYGVAGRLAVTGAASTLLFAALASVLLCTWWRARTTDGAYAGFVALGLLAAPVVWSQHLALLFVPAVVLLTSIIRRGSSATLAAWCALVLMLSLPDIAVQRLGAVVGGGFWGPTFPILPLALVGFWAWTLFADLPLTPSSAQPTADALGATV